MEYFIKILEIGIWPLFLAVVLIWLRKPIMKLLPQINSLRYKDFELHFNEELKEIAETNDELNVQPNANASNVQLIEKSPKATVLGYWLKVEKAARNKVKELYSDSSGYQQALKHPLEYLENSGSFIPSILKNLDTLRRLRNQISHKNGPHISEEAAVNYAEIAIRLISRIEAVSELPRLKLLALTLLILELNQLIDSGEFSDISIDEIYDEIEKKNVIYYLAKRTSGHSDFSLYFDGDLYEKFLKHYHDELYNIYGGYAGQHRRKWGVENSGLCLLLAWTNEIIQRGTGWYPSDQ